MMSSLSLSKKSPYDTPLDVLLLLFSCRLGAGNLDVRRINAVSHLGAGKLDVSTINGSYPAHGREIGSKAGANIMEQLVHGFIKI